MKLHQIALTPALLAFAAFGCTQTEQPGATAPSTSNARQAVDVVYSGFAAGDIAMAVSTMAPDIEWLEAEGNPYADKNPYVGPDAIVSGLFARLGGDWQGFSATPQEFVIEDNRVIVLGRYSGVYHASSKTLDSPFVHSWTVEDGKIVKFQQFTDTAGQVAAMTVDIEQ